MREEKVVKQKILLDVSGRIEQLRTGRPLVHCITNAVTANDCANLLLAAGASPTMAHHVLEVEEVTAGCKALVCNLGATDAYEAMMKAAVKSSLCRHPIVVDPVGAGGSAFRRDYLKKLCSQADITCIRGNVSEIRALAMDRATVTGVDADRKGEETLEETVDMAEQLASQTGSIVITSGETDIVTDGETSYLAANGHPMMTHITGCGCMSAALLGAYLAAGRKTDSGQKKVESCLTAVTVMNICGEAAAHEEEAERIGPMQFRMRLIDEMYLLDPETTEAKAKIYQLR